MFKCAVQESIKESVCYERFKPRQRRAANAEMRLETVEQDGMVDGVEG